MEWQTSALLRGAPRAKQAAPGGREIRTWLRRRYDLFLADLARGTFFLPIIAAALWALTHPYQGIVGDASVYIGRALADLDPEGLGRDLLFAHDGQSQFSLYPRLVRILVSAWGTDRAALALVLSSTALWIAALAVLARRFVTWQRVWIILAIVAVLPVNYGAPQRFGFSEMLAVPRPMAEALVLLALAAFLECRTLAAFGVLALATLFHPLMALAGWAALGLALALEDRRWWIAGAIGVVALALGAWLGVPLLDRLPEAMAPDLKAFAAGRSPLLFPTHWPLEFLGPIFAQAASIAVAASLWLGRQRRLMIAAIVVGIFGIGVQALFGDILSSLLVIQVQFWRMAWLSAVIGGFALALCAFELWTRGAVERVVLALLAMTWMASDAPVAAGFLAAIAMVLHFTKDRLNWPISTLSVRLIWTVTCLLALYANANYFAAYAQFLAQVPADSAQGFSYLWNKRYAAFPIGALVLALMLPERRSGLIWACRATAALALAVAAAVFWDCRTPFQHVVDKGVHPPELLRVIAAQPGEVLWIGGLGEAWYLTGRPQWASRQQGVANVFSRELTTAWRERMMFLRDEGLAERGALNSVFIPSSADLPHVSAAGMAHLCARADAPAWVVAPLDSGTNPLADRGGEIWHAPQPVFKMTDEGNAYAWHRIADFLILPCKAP
jgi:hypothetical protein